MRFCVSAERSISTIVWTAGHSKALNRCLVTACGRIGSPQGCRFAAMQSQEIQLGILLWESDTRVKLAAT